MKGSCRQICKSRDCGREREKEGTPPSCITAPPSLISSSPSSSSAPLAPPLQPLREPWVGADVVFLIGRICEHGQENESGKYCLADILKWKKLEYMIFCRGKKFTSTVFLYYLMHMYVSPSRTWSLIVLVK